MTRSRGAATAASLSQMRYIAFDRLYARVLAHCFDHRTALFIWTGTRQLQDDYEVALAANEDQPICRMVVQ